MKNNSQKEQNEKKKEALNEYRDALKEVDYWAAKVESMEKSNGYRSPDAANTATSGQVGNPREAKRRVLALIKQAPAGEQRVLLMRHYIDGMSWEDAAEAEGKSRTWATNNHGTALLHIQLPEQQKKR